MTLPALQLSVDDEEALAQIDALRHVQPLRAAQACERLIAASEHMVSPLAHLEAAQRYVLVMEHLGRVVEARSAVFSAMQVVQTLGLTHYEARLLELLARGYYSQAEYWAAIQYWGRAAEVSELPGGEARTWVLSKVGIAHVYDALGDHAAAIDVLESIQNKAEEVDDAYFEAKVKISLGTDLAKVGRTDEARVVLSRALDISSEHRVVEYSAESLFRLAEIDLNEGLFERAEHRLNAALSLSRSADHSWSETNILGALARIYSHHGRHQQALDTVAGAIEISSRGGLLHVLERQLLASAQYAGALGDHALAYRQLKAGNELTERIQETTAPERRRWLEEKAGLRVSRSRLLFELSNLTSIDEGEFDTAIRVICQRAVGILDVSRVVYRSLDIASGLLVETCLAAAPDASAKASPGWRHSEVPEFGVGNDQGAAVIAHDVRHHVLGRRLLASYFEPMGIASMLAFPINLAGRMQGVLLIEQQHQPRNWSPDDLLQARQLAEIVVRAVAGRERIQFRHEIGDLNHRLRDANRVLELKVEARSNELAAKNAQLHQAMTQLVQAEKLASLGSLVAGVAHELNTPIGTALTAVSTLEIEAGSVQRMVDSGEVRRSQLQRQLALLKEGSDLAQRNLERAAQLIQNFKQVAVDTASMRRRRFELKSTLNDVLSTLAPMLRRTLHRVELDVDDGIVLDSFPGPLEQVVTNFVTNSLTHGFSDEIPGCIRIQARQQGGRVALVYEDDGCGIAPEARKHVFDPFFTTRLGEGGSGLGLYLVFSLVTGSLGGTVRLDDSKAGGARFLLDLPLLASISTALEAVPI